MASSKAKLAIVVVFASMLAAAVYIGYYRVGIVRVYEGSLYANDCGEPRGGFEWAGEYNVTLKVDGEGKGKLEVVLVTGLGDPLNKHEYEVSGFYHSGDEMRMKIEGELVVLRFVENDTVWNKYHGYYIAYSNRGEINPEIFDGFKEHYYVELRIEGHEETPTSPEELVLAAVDQLRQK